MYMHTCMNSCMMRVYEFMYDAHRLKNLKVITADMNEFTLPAGAVCVQLPRVCPRTRTLASSVYRLGRPSLSCVCMHACMYGWMDGCVDTSHHHTCT